MTKIDLPAVLREFGADMRLRDSENMGPTRCEVALATEVARLRAQLAAAERANAELNVEVSRLYACRNELQDVTQAMDDPSVNNARSLEDAIHTMKAQLAEAGNDLDLTRQCFEEQAEELRQCIAQLAEAQRERDVMRAVLDACEATFCDLINTLDHDEDCPWWDEERTTPEAENWPACGCWRRGVEIMRGNVREVLSGQKDAITEAEREREALRQLVDDIEQMAVDDQSGCTTCARVVNACVSFAALEPPK